MIMKCLAGENGIIVGEAVGNFIEKFYAVTTASCY